MSSASGHGEGEGDSLRGGGSAGEWLVAGQAVGGGRFLLERRLGQGGMGVVWLAQDRLLRERVALKFLPPQVATHPGGLAGLRRETSQARRLAHPNIVRVHDLIDPPGESSFICMEFVEGMNLHRWRTQQAGEVVPWTELKPLFLQVATALHYAHGEGVIHHDIKPSNLLINSAGRLKLADFGLARVISDSISRVSSPSSVDGPATTHPVHTVGGTIEYMSPQQADGGPPTVGDDIYAVGATFYELLTGTPPFYRGDVSYQIRHADPEPLGQRLAAAGRANVVPPAVEALLMACLAKEAAGRPCDAGALLAWIERVDTGSAAVRTGDVLPSPPRLAASASSKKASADHPQDENGLPDPKRWRRPMLAAGYGAVALAGIFMAARVLNENAAPRRGAESPMEIDSASVPAKDSTGVSAEAGPAGDREFVSLFNGRDLKGWSGEPGVWSVVDGAITAWKPEEGVVRRQNTCLIWDGELGDFELQLQFRLTDVIVSKPANSGVMYRARVLTNWQVRGFQADLHGDFTGTLLVLREDGIDPRAELGRAVRIADQRGSTVIRNIGTIGDRAAMRELVRKEEWNTLSILSRGTRIVHQINGVTVLEAEDETPQAPGSNRLALEMKRATRVQFRDIRLKRL